MSIFVWDKSFELGIEQFDEHHRHLVGLLNKTYDDFTAGISQESLGSTLDELIDYATYHFAAEEHWMKKHRYPDLQQHQGEHERFSRRVVEIQKDYHGRKAKLSLEVLSFLKDWLSFHILKTDAAYGKFYSGFSDL
ncbi:MAG: bacteriohemerythrin [Oryzomonas sp.]|uniref:bacteriohemerythrin n=1 Tax=Oryzomonas sp. TaxID=2855186 RepID=UPI00284A9B0E|nr:bacteriohemerythrin [Oryzomonas sp.]MDR3580599.1 bacteriohemerythrin [Oryzomonas sp.]